MTNEPVFPHITGSHNVVSAKGMMLRDYFAAKAMQALIKDESQIWQDNAEKYAQYAYKMADAMLKAR